MKKPEQTLKVSETVGMLNRIASAWVKMHGEYYCMVDGKRTKVVAG